MQVSSRTPSLSAPFWMGCPDQTVESNAPEEEREKETAAKQKDHSLAIGGATSLGAGSLSIGISLATLAFNYFHLQWSLPNLVICKVPLSLPS